MTSSATQRLCTMCHETKPATEFYQSVRKGRGMVIESWCKPCKRVLLRSPKYRAISRESKRRYRATPEGAAASKASKDATYLRYRERYLERMRVRARLNRAVEQGLMQRLPCEVCGSPKTEGHHHDYSKPFDVRWLCRDHHAEEHAGPRGLTT